MSAGTYDVLIIGAGAAGLAASRALTAAGMCVAVVEARNRIGGRIFTHHERVSGMGNVPVEFGAEFVHGLPASSWDVIREAGLDTYELNGSQLCFETSRLQRCGREQQQSFEVLDVMANWLSSQPESTDLTFADYLRRQHVPTGSAERAAAYVEGFNAADRQIVGIAGLARQRAAEDLIEGDRIFHIAGGYEGLTQFLCREFIAQGGTLLLNRAINTVRWNTRRITAVGLDSSGVQFELTADRLLSTLPLGVLKAGVVEFSPALPELTRQASRLMMGSVLRVSLVFDCVFWHERTLLEAHKSIADELKTLSFVFSRDTHWPTWWTSAPDNAPVITAWAAGPRASQLDPDQLTHLAVADLARIFGMSAPALNKRLTRTLSHNWQTDPYSRGAYTYVPAGALDASQRLGHPYEDTVFFAGEHTDIHGHWGTVDAALNSGLRAATELLRTRG